MPGSWTTLLELLPVTLMIVFRIGGLMLFAPILSASNVPVTVRVQLAVLLGLALASTVIHRVEPAAPLPLDLWALGPAIAGEVMIGAVLGFAATLPVLGVQTAGLMMGQQMGLGFAQFFDPTVNDQTDVVGRLLMNVAIAGFFLVDGCERLVHGVLSSFERMPPGAVVAEPALLDLTLGLLGASFELAMRLASPLLTIILLESIAMGFVSKSVPQLNILSLGFPIRIIVGLALLAATLRIIDDQAITALDDALLAIEAWAHQPPPATIGSAP